MFGMMLVAHYDHTAYVGLQSSHQKSLPSIVLCSFSCYTERHIATTQLTFSAFSAPKALSRAFCVGFVVGRGCAATSANNKTHTKRERVTAGGEVT